MQLKRKLDLGEKPPEGLGDYYIQREDGVYHLDVDDAEGLKRSLAAERTQVRQLNERIKALESQRADPSPPPKRDESLADRLARLEKDMQQREQAYQASMSAAQAEKERVILERESARLAGRYPLEDGADEYVAQQIANTFTVENGQLIARDANKDLVYDAAGNPLTPDVYMDQLRRKNAFLFREPKGAGVGRNAGSGPSGFSPNAKTLPYTDENFQANLEDISKGKLVLDPSG